ncbi:MAG: GGDEF and EAL domain-containing protein [Gammaproteobacteria bacterium SHHR-1]|nr:GGDEF and EAL domain-containing protein [gamma proteobacterium SS-5]
MRFTMHHWRILLLLALILGPGSLFLLLYLSPGAGGHSLPSPLLSDGLLPLVWLSSLGLLLLLPGGRHGVAQPEPARRPEGPVPRPDIETAGHPLTGQGYLLDKYAFTRHLARLVGRNGGRGHLLLYVDLDQFNLFNTLYGLEQGDRLLASVGEVIRRNLPKHSSLCWHGEDEFVVVLEHCPKDRAVQVAETIRQRVAELNTRPLFALTLSMGLVGLDEFDGDISAALNAADMAAHTAKELGRNRLYVACNQPPEMSQRLLQVSSLSELSDAMQEGRLRLFCQTIAPLNPQRDEPILEILLRAQNRQGQWISPGAFLPAVERFGLSLPLDIWVIRQCFQWLHGFPPEQRPRVSINLSGHSLNAPELLELIKGEYRQQGLNPARICFEVTETAAMSDKDQAKRLLRELDELGFAIALDDFGTGHCSYAYLRDLPARFLKIDGVFVRQLERDPVNQELVAAINAMAHALGKRTIAEFVETPESLALLRKIGVDYAQGFYLGKPCLLELHGQQEEQPQRVEDLLEAVPCAA